MPFGMMNALATFQSAMDAVLSGIESTAVLCYLDDVLVFTKGTFEQHLHQLDKVLARLSECGFTCNAKKCLRTHSRFWGIEFHSEE